MDRQFTQPAADSRTPRTLYSELALLLQARANCIKSDNTEWRWKHESEIRRLVSYFMPSGSGIDNATKLDEDASSPNKLIFTFGYHHMNDNGYYDGWTDHTAIVTPDLQSGFNLRITGRDRNDIKEYLYQTFDCALRQIERVG